MSCSPSALFLLPVGFIPFGIPHSNLTLIFNHCSFVLTGTFNFLFLLGLLLYLSYRALSLGQYIHLPSLSIHSFNCSEAAESVSDSLLTMRNQLELASKEIIMKIHICICSGLLSSIFISVSICLICFFLLSFSLWISFLISHSHMDSPYKQSFC